MTARKRARRARGNPIASPWRDGPESARHTVQRKLRLRPDEDAALRAVADRDHDGDLSRAAGALALAAMCSRVLP